MSPSHKCKPPFVPRNGNLGFTILDSQFLSIRHIPISYIVTKDCWCSKPPSNGNHQKSLEIKMNCGNSRHDNATVSDAPGNSTFFGETDNKNIGEIHFLSPVITLSIQYMQNVTKLGVYVWPWGLFLTIKYYLQDDYWTIEGLPKMVIQ